MFSQWSAVCWATFTPPSPFHLSLWPPPARQRCVRTWCTGMLCVIQSLHLEDRATVCELWWRVCWPATMQTMPYSLIFQRPWPEGDREGGVMVSRFLPERGRASPFTHFYINDVLDNSVFHSWLNTGSNKKKVYGCWSSFQCCIQLML